MRISDQVKSISYLKANTAEVVRNLEEESEPLFITQNGETKVVIQGIRSYEQQQNTMALLKVLAIGNQQVEIGAVKSASEVLDDIRKG